MHLTKTTGETPIDRRFIGNNTNYQMNDSTINQRRISSGTTQLLRCRTSIDSCTSNGTTIKRHL
jgi:hypothetical protein